MFWTAVTRWARTSLISDFAHMPSWSQIAGRSDRFADSMTNCPASVEGRKMTTRSTDPGTSLMVL